MVKIGISVLITLLVCGVCLIAAKSIDKYVKDVVNKRSTDYIDLAFGMVPILMAILFFIYYIF